MAPMLGEFDIDPTTIPEPPSLPQNQDIVLEVASADVVEHEGEYGKSTRVKIRVTAPDLLGASGAFGTLWVTEKFKGKAHKSLTRFYETLNIPYTTRTAELVGLRFVGQVSEDKNGYFNLSKVVGENGNR